MSTNDNDRVFGQCNTSCMDHSIVNSMEFAATHRAFLLNRHWVVYLYATCPYHGSQTWTFEKFLDPGNEFTDNPNQTLEIGTIYISNSHLVNKMKTQRVHYFYNQNITLSQCVSTLSASTFYETFFFNCKNFGRVTYRDFEKLDNGPRGHYIGYGSWGAIRN